MKLTRITAKNLKGLSFCLDLTDINFLIGSNFAGKTARTDAIRLLLLGYLPELGKLASATFGLSSGKEMVVEGTTDTGLVIKRRWYLKGDSVKTEDEIPEELANVGTLAVMLNAEEYFALSERNRIAYVFANIPGIKGKDPADVVCHLQGMLTCDTELDSKATATVLAALDEERYEAEHQPEWKPWTPQSFIEWALGWVAEDTKLRKSRTQQFEKTVQGLASLRAAEQIDPAAAGYAATRAKLTEQLEKLFAERANLTTAMQEQVKNDQRRELLLKKLEGKAGTTAMIDAAKARHATVQAEFDAIPKVEYADIETFRVSVNDLTASIAQAQTDIRNLEAARDRSTAELADLQQKAECPYCHAVHDGWKEKKAAEIVSARDAMQIKIDLLRQHATERKALLEQQSAKHAALIALQRDLLTKERNLRSAAQDVHTCEKKTADWVGVEEELARIPQADPALPEKQRKAITAVIDMQAEIEKLDVLRQANEGRQNDLKRLAQAESERDASRNEEAASKAAAAFLRAAQAEMVLAAFKPLLETANAFFGQILQTPIAYHEGEIGTWRDGMWVGHRTFSGTEKALCYAAIQAALAARSPIRLMLIDELARLDDKNAAHLGSTIREAITSGRLIDTFVGIDTGRKMLYEILAEEDSRLTVTSV